MTVRADYRFVRYGTWRIWVHEQLWNASVWSAVNGTIQQQTRQGHPQTTRLKLRHGSEDAFLKTYTPMGSWTDLKDVFRVSKAIRHWQQSLALARHGFLTPLVIGAGEERSFRRIEKAFVLTKLVPATNLSVYVRGLDQEDRARFSTLEKRDYIRKLGDQIGRIHELGFVHGDMILSNILIRVHDGEVFYYYIDHDRTRRYPRWLPQTLWKRNLVQLNRLVLPGITLTDRMRFFHAYAAARSKSSGWHEARLLRWLESKTRKRRLGRNGVAGVVSFRELTRWDGGHGGESDER
jgi:serine/threonine protein kinase